MGFLLYVVAINTIYSYNKFIDSVLLIRKYIMCDLDVSNLFWDELIKNITKVKNTSYTIFIKDGIKDFGVINPNCIKHDDESVWMDIDSDKIVKVKITIFNKCDFIKPVRVRDDSVLMKSLVKSMAEYVIKDVFIFMDYVESDDVIKKQCDKLY